MFATADSELVQREILSNPALLLDVDGVGFCLHLAEAEWETLTEQVIALQRSVGLADFLRPWVATMLLEVPACEILARRDGAVALDRRIERFAQEIGVPTEGLDDVLEVLAFFTEVSEETQLDLLRMLLAATGGIDAEDVIATAIAAWLDSEPQVIWQIVRIQSATLVEDQEKLDELYRRVEGYLLAERNAAWLATILQRVAEAPEIMVAVGVRHLAGAEGWRTCSRRRRSPSSA